MTNKFPRVLHAYKTYYPDKGGISTIIQYIVERLQSLNHHEVLCTHQQFFGITETINQVNIHRLGSLGNLLSLPLAFNYPFILWKLSRQFDVLDYHFPMPWVDLAVAGYLPKPLKFIVHWHSEIIRQRKFAQVLSPFIHRCLKRADCIVVADKTAIDNSSWLKNYQDKCKVIPYGIDINKWQFLDEEETQKVQSLQKQHQRFILAVGRLVTYKGFSILIKAMKFIKVKLIIAGEGSLYTELQQLTKNLELENRIHFCTKASESDLKCLYHAAEVFVLPSITENEAFGIVQLEAMACSKPIVNTSLHSGVPSVARHGQEALTVPPGCVTSLASAINQLLSNSKMAKELGRNGFNRANSLYSAERFLRETEKLYRVG